MAIEQVNHWDQLYIHAKLAHMDSSLSDDLVIVDAGIAIKDGLIAWLGPMSDLPLSMNKLEEIQATSEFEIMDAEGCLMTPSLMDCHTHLVYAGTRYHEFEARLEGRSYTSIAQAGGGIQSTVNATRNATFDELLSQSLPRLKSLQSYGVGVVEIKSGYGLDLETEIRMLEVAQKLQEITGVLVKKTYLGAHAIPKEYVGQPDAYIDFICDEVLPMIKERQLADAVDGFCERIGFTVDQIERVFVKAKSLGMDVKLHAEQLTALGGSQLLAKYHGLSADHIEYATDADIHALAQASSVAVLLPGAYYYLGESKKPPVDLCRKYGVPMAIATDCNPGSSPTTHLPLMMNMACVYFGLTPKEALLGVTANAAHALGISDSWGCLAVGRKARMLLWPVSSVSELVGGIGFDCKPKILGQGEPFFVQSH